MKPIKTNWNIKRKRKVHVPYITLIVIGIVFTILSAMFDIVPYEQADNNTHVEYVENTESKNALSDNEINITFIDVDQGNCAIIYNKDASEVVMIDTGMYTEYESVCNTLDDAEITEIDCLVLTHPDADHISSAVELISDQRYTVSNVMQVYGIENDTDTYEMVQNTIDEYGVSVINPKAGDTYKYCGADFKVLGPVVTDQSVYDDTNTYSIVLRMDYGETSILFSADATDNTMKDIVLKGYDIDTDIYQVSHHGSANDCNNNIYMSMISPEASIVSCGKDNSYGFPHKEVQSFMEYKNIPMYRTDTMGNITITTDGKEYSVSTEY